VGIGTLRRYHTESEAVAATVEPVEAEVELTEALTVIGPQTEAESVADADADDAEDVPAELPPRSGTGSGVDVWRAYALTHGYTEKDVSELQRDDIADLFK